MRKVKISIKRSRYATVEGDRIIEHRSYSVNIPKDILQEVGILKVTSKERGKGSDEVLLSREFAIEVKEVSGVKAIVLVPIVRQGS